MLPEIESVLVQRHPKIFSVELSDSTRPATPWGIQCHDGWFNILDTLCSCIQQYVDNNKKEQVTAREIKEKFGELRFYYDNGDEHIRGMVDLAETWSLRACEVCGEIGVRKKTKNGWVITRCDRHAIG